ncbi:MAG: beta-hydroxyacyl-ACP dehydratase [Bacteroidales bacterium]|nr:beta-hydroxyacyl-ACP dehydratase [Bacteroidales bacterium]
MNREEIMKVIPHREPMLLLDQAHLGEDGAAHATYRIPDHPFFCEGHFPGNPIVPGVILCEIMAQSCFVLFIEAFERHLILYRGLDAVKFRGTVHPGDCCEITATLAEHKGSIFVCDAVLSVEGKRCAQARITLALTPKA